MGVKVVIGERVVNEYPCLKKATNNGQIVLFTERGTGTLVLSGNSSLEVGKHLDSWAEGHFELFNDTVALRNE